MVESPSPLLRPTTEETESCAKDGGNPAVIDDSPDSASVDNRNDDEFDFLVSHRSGFSSHASLHQGTAIGSGTKTCDDEDDDDEEILSDMDLPKNLKLVKIDEVLSDVRDSPFEADDPTLRRAMEMIMRSFPGGVDSSSTASFVDQGSTGQGGDVEMLSNGADPSSVAKSTTSKSKMEKTEDNDDSDPKEGGISNTKKGSGSNQSGGSIYRKALRYHAGKGKRKELRDDCSVDPVIEVKASTSTVETAGGRLYRKALPQKTKQNHSRTEIPLTNLIGSKDSDEKRDLISAFYGNAIEFISSFTSDQSAADGRPKVQTVDSGSSNVLSGSEQVVSFENDVRGPASYSKKEKISPESSNQYSVGDKSKTQVIVPKASADFSENRDVESLEQNVQGSGHSRLSGEDHKKELFSTDLSTKDDKSRAQGAESDSLNVNSKKMKVVSVEIDDCDGESATLHIREENERSESLDQSATNDRMRSQSVDSKSSGVSSEKRNAVSQQGDTKESDSDSRQVKEEKKKDPERLAQSVLDIQPKELVVDLTSLDTNSEAENVFSPEKDVKDNKGDSSCEREAKKSQEYSDRTLKQIKAMTPTVDLTSYDVFVGTTDTLLPEGALREFGGGVLQEKGGLSVRDYSDQPATDSKPMTPTIDLTTFDDIADIDSIVVADEVARAHKDTTLLEEKDEDIRKSPHQSAYFKHRRQFFDLTSRDDVSETGIAGPLVEQKHGYVSGAEGGKAMSEKDPLVKVQEEETKPFLSHGAFHRVAEHRRSPVPIFVEDLSAESRDEAETEQRVRFKSDQMMEDASRDARPTINEDYGSVGPEIKSEGHAAIQKKAIDVGVIHVMDDNEEVQDDKVRGMSQSVPQPPASYKVSHSALPPNRGLLEQQDSGSMPRDDDIIHVDEDDAGQGRNSQVTFCPVPTDDWHSNMVVGVPKGIIRMVGSSPSKVTSKTPSPARMVEESSEYYQYQPTRQKASPVSLRVEANKQYSLHGTSPADDSKPFHHAPSASPSESDPFRIPGNKWHSNGKPNSPVKTQPQEDSKAGNSSSFIPATLQASDVKTAAELSSRDEPMGQDAGVSKETGERNKFALPTPSKTAAASRNRSQAEHRDQSPVKAVNKTHDSDDLRTAQRNMSPEKSETHSRSGSPTKSILMRKSPVEPGRQNVGSVKLRVDSISHLKSDSTHESPTTAADPISAPQLTNEGNTPFQKKTSSSTDPKSSSRGSDVVKTPIRVMDPIKRTCRSLSPKKVTKSRDLAFPNKMSRSISPVKRAPEHRQSKISRAAEPGDLHTVARRKMQREARADRGIQVQKRSNHYALGSFDDENITASQRSKIETMEDEEKCSSRDAASLKEAMKKELLETIRANEKAEHSESVQESLAESKKEAPGKPAGGERDKIRQTTTAQGASRKPKPRKKDIRVDLDDFTKVVMPDSELDGADRMEKSVMRLVCNDDKGSRIAPVVSNYSQDLAISDCETSSSDSPEEDEAEIPSSQVDNDYDSRPGGAVKRGRRSAEEGSEESVDDDENTRSNAQDSDSKASLCSILETEESDLDMDHDDMYESFTVPFVVKLLDKSCAWLEGNDDFTCGYKKPSLLSETKKCPPKMSSNQNAVRFRSKLTKQSKTKRKDNARTRSKATTRIDTGAVVPSTSKSSVPSSRESSFPELGLIPREEKKTYPQEEKQTTPKASNTRATKAEKDPVIEKDSSLTPKTSANRAVQKVGSLSDTKAVQEEKKPAIEKDGPASPRSKVKRGLQKENSPFVEGNITGGVKDAVGDQSAAASSTERSSEDQQERTEHTSHKDEPQSRKSPDVLDLTADDDCSSPERGADPPGDISPPTSPFQAKLQQRLARIRGDTSDTGSSVEGDSTFKRFETFSRKEYESNRAMAGDRSTADSVNSRRSAGGPESRFASPSRRSRAGGLKGKTNEHNMEKIQEDANVGQATKTNSKETSDSFEPDPSTSPSSLQCPTLSPNNERAKEVPPPTTKTKTPKEDANPGEMTMAKETETKNDSVDFGSSGGSEKRLASPSRRSRTASPKKKKLGEHHSETPKDSSSGETSSKRSKESRSVEAKRDDSSSELDAYSTLTEEERLAALDLAERLRRRAAALKRRRKVREKRLKELEEMEEDGRLESSSPIPM